MSADSRVGGDLTRGFATGRASLVTYLMAGYPSHEGSLAAVRAAAAAGADIIELGVPYGDALADGPVIVRAANAAMRASDDGYGLAEALHLAEEFHGDPGVAQAPPVALMTYLNPMLRMGLGRVADEARRRGVAGFIVPDMPPDAAGPWLEVAGDLGTVFLAAPTSTDERLALIGRSSSGFVYCVSTTGVTGERETLPEDLPGLVERIRRFTDLPVAVGFGISTPEQAAAVARIADGVVVGSAVVRRQTDPDEVAEFVGALATQVRQAR